MMGLSVTPNDTSGVFALLNVLADPVKTKAKLDELVARIDAADKAMAAASVAEKAARAAEALAMKTKLEAEQAVAEAKRLSAANEFSFKQGGQTLSDRAAALDNLASELAERERVVALEQGELKVRETAVDAQEKRLDAKAADLADKQAKLDRRLDALAKAANA